MSQYSFSAISVPYSIDSSSKLSLQKQGKTIMMSALTLMIGVFLKLCTFS